MAFFFWQFDNLAAMRDRSCRVLKRYWLKENKSLYFYWSWWHVWQLTAMIIFYDQTDVYINKYGALDVKILYNAFFAWIFKKCVLVVIFFVDVWALMNIKGWPKCTSVIILAWIVDKIFMEEWIDSSALFLLGILEKQTVAVVAMLVLLICVWLFWLKYLFEWIS